MAIKRSLTIRPRTTPKYRFAEKTDNTYFLKKPSKIFNWRNLIILLVILACVGIGIGIWQGVTQKSNHKETFEPFTPNPDICLMGSCTA